MLGIVITFSACKKDDDSSDSTYDVKYNEASVDENKGTIEDNGIEFTQEMDAMKELEAVEVASNMASLNDKGGFPMGSSAMQMIPINILSALKKSSSPNSISAELKSVTEDPENLEEVWDQIVGVYEYNSTIDEFETVSQGGNEVIIKFPGKEGDITNNAQFKINNFNYVEITEPVFTEEGEDYGIVGQQLPISVHAELTYEGSVLSTFDFSASYKNNGIPTKCNSTLAVNPYSISVSISHDPYSNASSKFSFEKRGKILLETFAEMNGDWSKENIEDNVETVREVNEYYTDESTEVTFENIVSNANAYFQILNIKVAGMVDIKSLATKVNDYEDQLDAGTITEETYASKMAEAINAHAKLVVLNIAENRMIAKVQAYKYYDDEYDEWYASAKFVFGDGSSIDSETYMANEEYREEFGDLIDQINALIDDFKADYKLDIDPI